MAAANEQPAAPTTTQVSATPGPGYRHAIDQDFAISILMELQKSMGKVEGAMQGISDDVGELKKKVSRIEQVMYCAGVLLIIFMVVGGWMLNAAKDLALVTYQQSLEHSKPPVNAPGKKNNF